MTTKAQEREALAKIKEIIESMGTDSYIGMAFDGCIEKAEENIEYDMAGSYKANYERAEEERKILQAENESLKAENESLKARSLTRDDLLDISGYMSDVCDELEDMATKYSERIVEFAEDPDAADFRIAVNGHRASMRKAARCKAIVNKINEILRKEWR